ncbi:MAG: DUF3488 and transglutaminase-like domain-containing protein [Oscillospiraceae bacterium]|nr:DUF3488 and transglutaminase-like domain-containing protein [Oscillospiraceae bacterium]
MKIHRAHDTVFLLTIGTLLSFSGFSATLHIGGFVQGQLTSLLQMFVVILAFRLLLANKILAWTAVSLFMFGLSLLAIGFFTTPEEPRLANEMADFVTAVVQYVSGHGQHNLLYERTFIWLLAGFIGLFTVLLVYWRPNFVVVFLVFAGIFGVLISIYFFSYFFLFYLFICCSLVLLIKHLSHKFFLHLALPVALVCVVLAGFIPIPSDEEGGLTYQIAQADLIASLRRMGDGPDFMTRPHYFGLQQTGFGGGDSRRLGGNINTNDGLFMRIRTESPPPIYLTGSIMDTYTGYSWENQLREQSLPDFAARYESFTTWIYHLAQYDENFTDPNLAQLGISFGADDFLPKRTMLIGGLNRGVHTIFHQGFVQGFDAYPAEFTVLQEQSGQLVTRELMPADTWYTLTYHPLYYDVDEFVEWLRHYSHRGIMREVSAKFEDQLIPMLSFTDDGGIYTNLQLILQHDLIPRADWIYETYTALPDEFPARIGELARSITADAENNYARAQLLETYLRTQFTYSLTPGMPPAGRDFVDYFLFDSLVGYCTYFATAFVTMARSLGIPARYVEGFLVTGDPDDEGYIRVLNSMGHAWGEVYLEGYGWLRFEPTPAAADSDPPEEEDVPVMGAPIDGIPDIEQPEPTTPTPADTGSATIAQGQFWVPLLLLVALAVIALLFWVVRAYLHKEKVRKFDNRESVYYNISILLKYFKRLRLPMKKTETIFQFYRRLADALGSSNELLPSLETLEIYAKACYGDAPISSEERETVAREVQRIAGIVQSLRYRSTPG